FLMLPSSTLGMGGVRLAIDDPLGDGWTNPAKGVLIDETVFLGAPSFYGISNNGGGGRTFPIAGLLAGSPVFGGVALALQQIENGGSRRHLPPSRRARTSSSRRAGRSRSRTSA
ncbi:MAG TPA: hypothetical protein VMN39_12230, partial [Longimicrobiaceae bacterium]|nr:hypothetical protein [Longimicrobiaceae bacterium]